MGVSSRKNATVVVIVTLLVLFLVFSHYWMTFEGEIKDLKSALQKNDLQNQRIIDNVASDNSKSYGQIQNNAFNGKIPVEQLSAEKEFERIWNYVYKMQYNCTESEYLGGRPLDRDGAYDLCTEDKFWPVKRNPNSQCLMYSFGVGNDFTFDDEIANRGCEVHSFDPSMNNLKDGEVRPSGVTFHKIGISNQNIDKDANGWKMRTLKKLLEELGHVGRYMDYLKIDTDAPQGGFEDTLMQELLDTGMHSCVRQYAMEIHLQGPITSPPKLKRCRSIYSQMVHLNSFGWKLYNTTDNVRAARIIQKNPNFSQKNIAPGMVKSGGTILWETAFVNFNVQRPCIT